MGKVSSYLIIIGLVFLVSAVVLTMLSLIFPAFNLNLVNLLSLAIFVVTIFLYVVAFVFIILGIIVAKRDKE